MAVVRITIPACPGCCDPCLSYSSTLEAVFSGVGDTCPTCVEYGGSGFWISGTANDLDGMFTLTKVGDFWRYTIVNGFHYTLYTAEGCATPFFSSVADLEIVATCSPSDGTFLVDAFATLDSNRYYVFTALSVALDSPGSNTEGCGGTVTLSEP